MRSQLIVAMAVGLLASTASLAAASTPPLSALMQGWAHANYEIADPAAKLSEMEALAQQADASIRERPGQADYLVWGAIINGTEAGLKGGLGGLALAKNARDLALKAEAINPAVLDGSVYSTLGSLYDQVPGFPVGFGDKKKARAYLMHAVNVNPTGIDSNYFLAVYLNGQGDYAGAERALTIALNAPPRPGREVADKGRRQEIAALMAKVRAKLKS